MGLSSPSAGVDDRTLGRLLDVVQKPGRYIGGELHRVTKDPARAEMHVCLAFPDAYEIGMSHLGLRILYAHLNSDPAIFVERAYCPFPDMEARMRAAGIPLFSVETRTPLARFDVVGFSLQSEMTHTNVLTMLDLGRIPLHREDRGEDAPIVIAGGPVVFNPEPVSDFFDVFLVGDGEEAFARFLHHHRALAAAGVPRAERLRRLAGEIDGLYVPALYDTHRDPDTGQVHVVPTPGAPHPVRKALLGDLNRFSFPADILVPQSDIVHDRVAVEIARGCTEGCRFCQAGIIYRPVRERTPESIVQTIIDGVDRTGFDEASLTALSTADYSCITPLARAVMAQLQTRRAAMSVSSLRVYGVTEELAREIARVRKTGFTIAPEAGSQRMRDVINKGITDTDIDTAAEIAFANGWNRLKLYFMIGLPTESDADILGIAETAIRVARIGKRLGARRLAVVVSVSSFVPKAHSIFQWVRFDDPANLRRKQRFLAERLRPFRAIELKCHDVRLSRLEAVFSRGDRRLGRVIETAWCAGARFDEWTEYFREDIWETAFASCGVDPGSFLAALPVDAPLVWDHIDSRVTKEFMLKDLRSGLASRFRHPCEKPYLPKRHDPPRTRDGIVKLICYDCGVDCDLKAIAVAREESAASAGALAAAPQGGESLGSGRNAGARQAGSAVQPLAPTPGPLYRYRVCYSKSGLSRYLSHLEVVRLIDRATRRARWPVAFSGGFHPHPKISFGPALPVGVAGLNECFDIELFEEWDVKRLHDTLDASLHEGFPVHAVRCLDPDTPGIEALVDRHEYTITFVTDVLQAAGGIEGLRHRLMERLAGGEWMITRTGGDRARTVDAAPLVADWGLAGDHGATVWRLTILSQNGRTVRPRELVESLFGSWPEGTIITRRAMGRLVDGRLVTPMEVQAP